MWQILCCKEGKGWVGREVEPKWNLSRSTAIARTVARLKTAITWPGLLDDVTAWVKKRSTRQRKTAKRPRPAVLLATAAERPFRQQRVQKDRQRERNIVRQQPKTRLRVPLKLYAKPSHRWLVFVRHSTKLRCASGRSWSAWTRRRCGHDGSWHSGDSG